MNFPDSATFSAMDSFLTESRQLENVKMSSTQVNPRFMTHVLMPLLLVYVRSHVRSSSIGVNFLVSEKKL